MNTETTLTEEEAVKELRKLFPKMRRTRSTAIAHSGGKQTIYRCVCGSIHTAATDYRHAKHVGEWENNHSNCAAQILADYKQNGGPIEIHFGR